MDSSIVGGTRGTPYAKSRDRRDNFSNRQDFAHASLGVEKFVKTNSLYREELL